MKCVCKVTLMGRVGQDPKVGNGVARFSVATAESWKDKESGEWKEKTTWTNVVAFGPKADYVAKKVSKGQPVYLEGRGESGEYTDKNGQKVKTWEVNLQELILLPRAEKGNGASQGERDGSQAPHPAPAASNPAPSHGTGGFDDDDFPL